MRRTVNDLVRKFYTDSGLSFADLGQAKKLSYQKLHNWASGKSTQTPDVRMLTMLLEQFTEKELCDAIKASASRLKKQLDGKEDDRE